MSFRATSPPSANKLASEATRAQPPLGGRGVFCIVVFVDVVSVRGFTLLGTFPFTLLGTSPFTLLGTSPFARLGKPHLPVWANPICPSETLGFSSYSSWALSICPSETLGFSSYSSSFLSKTGQFMRRCNVGVSDTPNLCSEVTIMPSATRFAIIRIACFRLIRHSFHQSL